MDTKLKEGKQKAQVAYNASKRLLDTRLAAPEKDFRLLSLAKSTLLKKWTDLENSHYELISKAESVSQDDLEKEEENWNDVFLKHEDLLAQVEEALDEIVPRSKETDNYKITLITKSGWFAWFGVKTVRIILVGDKGESEADSFRSIDSSNKKSFDTYEFLIDKADVGNIENIQMNIPEDDEKVVFFLEKIHVEKQGTVNEFPIFEWITNDTTATHIFTSNKTNLPQNESEFRRRARLLQVRVAKQSLNWSHAIAGLPGSAGFLKMDEVDTKYRPPLEQELVKKEKLALKTFSVNSDGFEKDETAESCWVYNWESDEEFGRQALNGAMPVLIKKIKSLPKNFPVASHVPDSSLQRGWSLEKEMEEGNIFLQDFEMLEGVRSVTKEGGSLAVPAALVLYYLTPSGDLVPLAIQLGQTPGSDCPIWTPADSDEDWLFAKMWVGSAIGQASQLFFHLSMCHFAMEVFAVAMLRCLPPAHPIHKLLKENFQFIVFVNTGGREIVLGGGLDSIYAVGSNGTLDLMKKHFSRSSFNKNVQQLQSKHPAELLLTHAGVDELIQSDFSIFVLVHFCKCRFCNHFLCCDIWVLGLQHAVHVFGEFCHLCHSDGAISIHIKDSEYLRQNFLRFSIRHN